MAKRRQKEETLEELELRVAEWAESPEGQAKLNEMAETGREAAEWIDKNSYVDPNDPILDIPMSDFKHLHGQR